MFKNCFICKSGIPIEFECLNLCTQASLAPPEQPHKLLEFQLNYLRKLYSVEPVGIFLGGSGSTMLNVVAALGVQGLSPPDAGDGFKVFEKINVHLYFKPQFSIFSNL